MKKIRLLAACICAALLTSGMLKNVEAREEACVLQKELAQEVFRFHVIADSDTEEDQRLKMKVKEGILDYMKEELPRSNSVEETKEWTNKHLKEIEQRAEAILRENGGTDAVHATVERCHFPEKTYGDVTFPKGDYEALRIKIGRAEGQNWWCVLYPNLCFLDAVHAVVPEEGKEQLKEALDEETYEMVTTGTTFQIRWFFLGDRSSDEEDERSRF